MTYTQVDAPAPARRVARRPVLGALAGFVLGLGVALLLVSFAVIALGTLTPVVIVVVGLLAGLLLALFLPPMGGGAADAAPAPGAEWTAPPVAAPAPYLPLEGSPPPAATAAPAAPAPPPAETAPPASSDGGDVPPPPPGPPGPPLR